MKVYQLMTLLEKAPAGADVTVSLTATLAAGVVGVDQYDGNFQLCGGDAMIINDDGEDIGLLSEHASTDEEGGSN